MKLKVRIFIQDKQIDTDKLNQIVIKNATIDRIVNDVIDRNNRIAA